jgi:hypothetical protein
MEFWIGFIVGNLVCSLEVLVFILFRFNKED